MNRQSIILRPPTKGLRTAIAPTLIGDDECALAENIEFVAGKIRKCAGNETAITTITDSTEPRAVHNFRMTDGTEKILIFERGATGSLVKKIYVATVGTWTWTALQKSGSDYVMNSARTPRFLTMRGKVFFSNGETTDGLVYWSGSGDVVSVHSGGSYGASGRFLAQYKERLIVANGYYYSGGSWVASRLSSGVFFSSIVNSSGDPVNPDSSDAWWNVATTYHEIAPDDGAEITALWVWKDRIYVGKRTGIWAMYGNSPEDMVISKITDIGIETDHLLQEFNGMYIFKNQDGFYAFDGGNQPQLIDRPIKNLVSQIPRFDVGGSSDILSYGLDTYDEWSNNESSSSNDIYIDTSGFIRMEKGNEFTVKEQTTYSNTIDPVTNGWYGLAFKIHLTSSDIPFFLSAISIRCVRDQSPSGQITFSLVKGNIVTPESGEVIDTVTKDISDLPSSIGWYKVDFGATAKIEETGYYWILMEWTNLDTNMEFSYFANSTPDYSQMAYKTAYGNWYYSQTLNKWGAFKLYGKTYPATSSTYYSEGGDFGDIPTQWGTFETSDTNNQAIAYSIRSSPDQSTWTSWEYIRPGNIPTITPQRYVEFQIILTRVNKVTSPTVDSITINAFIDTTELNDRLACSTVFDDKYIAATNINLDGEYRTFVFDKEGRWSIRPNQLIRGFVSANNGNNMYLMTVDTNTKLHKMYVGQNAEEYKYDYSCKGVTGSEWYYQKLETKKFDCGFPGILKLFKEARLSIGSVYSAGYVDGIIKYKIDDGNWVTQYFQDNNDSGDVSVIKLIFPEGKRGYRIQFRFETYKDATSHYGHPFNIQNIELDFFIQPGLSPTKETQSTALTDTGYLVE